MVRRGQPFDPALAGLTAPSVVEGTRDRQKPSARPKTSVLRGLQCNSACNIRASCRWDPIIGAMHLLTLGYGLRAGSCDFWNMDCSHLAVLLERPYGRNGTDSVHHMVEERAP